MQQPVASKPVSGFSAKAGRRHFHTFDALRFLAFFKVFLLHVPIVAFPWFNYLKAGGGIGVQFFFVLSGFLITYIIYEEKQRTGTISLKRFFMRRILRIWPLYYLMVAIAYLTPYILQWLQLPSSQQGYEPKLWVSLLFLENYMMMYTHDHANVSPLSVMWSLCIEEHFYIIWGLLLGYLNIKRLPIVITVCIVLAIVCRIVYVQNNIPTSDIFTNIDLFAFGAIPAYLLLMYGDKVEEVISKISFTAKLLYAALILLAVTVFSQYSGDAFFIWITTILGALFAGLILLTLPTHTRFSISNRNMLSRLGIYTYGLYLYHTLVINLLLKIASKAGVDINEPVGAIVFFSASLLITIAISIASYYVFEKPFLKLKRYFR